MTRMLDSPMAAPAMPWTVDRDEEMSVVSILIRRFVKKNDDGEEGFTKIVPKRFRYVYYRRAGYQITQRWRKGG